MRIVYDKSLYTKEALLKAAYHFTDKAYIYLGIDGSSYFIDFQNKDGGNFDETLFQNQFKNEILAQVIHQIVSNETQDIRKMLIARALSSTILDENNGASQNTTNCENSEDFENELNAITQNWFKGK